MPVGIRCCFKPKPARCCCSTNAANRPVPGGACSRNPPTTAKRGRSPDAYPKGFTVRRRAGRCKSPTARSYAVRAARTTAHEFISSAPAISESPGKGPPRSTIRVRSAQLQPGLLALGGDKYVALGRTGQGKPYRVATTDSGQTWTQPQLLELPNSGSALDAMTLADGRHVLIYNHAAEKKNAPLNIAVSTDGTTWQAAAILEDGPGTFDYPAAVQTTDGRLHVVYRYQKDRLKHVTVDPKRLVGRDFVDGAWPK
ncbi:MAG: exo-alpha-sialidase [Pirellulales bacterium]